MLLLSEKVNSQPITSKKWWKFQRVFKDAFEFFQIFGSFGLINDVDLFDDRLSFFFLFGFMVAFRALINLYIRYFVTMARWVQVHLIAEKVFDCPIFRCVFDVALPHWIGRRKQCGAGSPQYFFDSPVMMTHHNTRWKQKKTEWISFSRSFCLKKGKRNRSQSEYAVCNIFSYL